MPKVRTTLWPDRELEVDEAEEKDLRAQGLLLDDEGAEASDEKED